MNVSDIVADQFCPSQKEHKLCDDNSAIRLNQWTYLKVFVAMPAPELLHKVALLNRQIRKLIADNCKKGILSKHVQKRLMRIIMKMLPHPARKNRHRMPLLAMKLAQHYELDMTDAPDQFLSSEPLAEFCQ